MAFLIFDFLLPSSETVFRGLLVLNLNSITQTISRNIKKIPDQRIAEAFLWGVPAVVVPCRQYLDKDRTNGDSKELRYRDIITYTAGPLSYFAGEIGMSRFIKKAGIKPLKNLSEKGKKIVSISTGMLLYMGWATYGAVHLAKKLVKHKKKPEVQKPENPFETTPKNLKPVSKSETILALRTPDELNPYYLLGMSNYTQSFGKKDRVLSFKAQ